MPSYLLPLTAPAAEIGAKAAGLGRARGAGVRAPDGWVVSARAYEESLRAVGGPFALPATGDPLPALERAQAALAAAPLPAGLLDELCATAAPLGDRLAVRSSALALEDSPTASAAGIFRSQIAV